MSSVTALTHRGSAGRAAAVAVCIGSESRRRAAAPTTSPTVAQETTNGTRRKSPNAPSASLTPMMPASVSTASTSRAIAPFQPGVNRAIIYPTER